MKSLQEKQPTPRQIAIMDKLTESLPTPRQIFWLFWIVVGL
jgi:hypothetical protein